MRESPPPSVFPPQSDGPQATPLTEEEIKKEKVRKAARERQRKHRALLKAKRMSQLDDSPAPSPVPPMWSPPPPPPQSAVPAPGPPPLAPHGISPFDPALGIDPHAPFRPPPPNPTPGQTFANTLLLALYCAPMLKAHLMRTLHISNPDLETLEHVIAQACDQWDHQRRITMHPDTQPPQDHQQPIPPTIPPPQVPSHPHPPPTYLHEHVLPQPAPSAPANHSTPPEASDTQMIDSSLRAESV